jgi:peptidoglycan/LPS O-acetylase OafA/YrhL
MRQRATSPASDRHLAALTGLRGLAASMVTLMHLWQFGGQPTWRIGALELSPLAVCGYLGVDLFFVLSGFLLAAPFVRARNTGQPLPSLARFWRHRMRRVLPALWAQIAILFALGWCWSGAPPASAFELLAQATLTFNLFESATLNPVYWSLPIEWNYYMVLPLLAFAFVRAPGWPWRLLWVALLVLLVRVACVWAVQRWGLDGIGVARWIVQLPGRVDQFALGMFAAWVVLRGALQPLRHAGAALAWSGIALLLVLMWTLAPLGDVMARLQVPRAYFHYSVVALAFAMLIVGLACGAGPLLQRLFASRVLGFIGVISYSVYLWHYPLLEALRALDVSARIGSATLTWWLFAPACIVALSWLSYRCFELPFLRANRRDVSDPRSCTPAVSSPPASS